MTDEQIIKALECCHKFGDFGCGCCPISDEMCCRDDLKTSVLYLINRQKAELSALYKIMNKQDEEISELNRKVASRENLEESFLKTTKEFDKSLEKQVKLERREAIKEFAERLKNKNVQGFWDENAYVGVDDIDNLVKEMTEGE